ncbi:stage IV sporulation protein A [Intestinibacillus massiliensis]|uniref:stage IV sporulation protein A n=1 Tax=Intestinibacillus massiliensis TaxID=1871029 RepID=UPI000B354E35|nr:stage IV sporulation protein A [Intestinibacillus massiliensis]
MDNKSLYEDIGRRTGGDIYIGVVGPVRTGKSTFIKRFMETMVLPGIDNVYKRERAKDELPQSGSGRTIMTAEPKFVPEEAAEISTPGGGSCRVRLVDCVGYLVDGALGSMEDDVPRMVSTPWSDDPIPMSQAAEIGTKKVISEHSTIGLVITTDGTITDIPRGSYVDAEDRVIRELQNLGKPFLALVNSREPDGEAAQAVRDELRQKHGVEALAVDCMALETRDIADIISNVLYEFPVREIGVELPRFVGALPQGHPVQNAIYGAIREAAVSISKMRDMQSAAKAIGENEYVAASAVSDMNLGSGNVRLHVDVPNEVFYKIVGEQTGVNIRDEADLIPILAELSETKRQYERVQGALEQVRATGYGIVMPSLDELTLEEPEIVKQGGRYGVKLRASAPSIHLIRADIQTEVSPIVGSEKQSEELVHYLLSEFDEEPERIWQSNIFGKSLSELVGEGLNNKLGRMPEEARGKIQETLTKIINEGSGGLICIIL